MVAIRAPARPAAPANHLSAFPPNQCINRFLTSCRPEPDSNLGGVVEQNPQVTLLHKPFQGISIDQPGRRGKVGTAFWKSFKLIPEGRHVSAGSPKGGQAFSLALLAGLRPALRRRVRPERGARGGGAITPGSPLADGSRAAKGGPARLFS